MKKTTFIYAFFLLLSGATIAQVTTMRSLTWNLTGTQTWPKVSGIITWDNKANWVITGTSTAPSTNVTNGDKLIIPNTPGVLINVSDMPITFTNFILQVQGAGTINIVTKQTLTMSGASTAFDLVNVTASSGLTLEKAAGANSTSLIMSGNTKAVNKSSSAIQPGSTLSLHALSTDASSTSTTGYGGFLFGALPIRLGTFSASVIGGTTVSVNWNTLQETNTDHFTVEKSTDGVHWSSLANLKAAGNSATSNSYHLTDENPSKGSNYYRIITVDLDGKTSISATRNVQFNSFGKITLYPNPTVNQVTVTLPAAPGDWSLSLLNHAGQVLLQNRYTKGTTTVSMPVSAYPAGDYIIQIYDGSQVHNSKLVISR